MIPITISDQKIVMVVTLMLRTITTEDLTPRIDIEDTTGVMTLTGLTAAATAVGTRGVIQIITVPGAIMAAGGTMVSMAQLIPLDGDGEETLIMPAVLDTDMVILTTAVGTTHTMAAVGIILTTVAVGTIRTTTVGVTTITEAVLVTATPGILIQASDQDPEEDLPILREDLPMEIMVPMLTTITHYQLLTLDFRMGRSLLKQVEPQQLHLPSDLLTQEKRMEWYSQMQADLNLQQFQGTLIL